MAKAKSKLGTDLRKKAPVKKKTSIGMSPRTKLGQPNRGLYPPAGGRRYRKKYRGQGKRR